MIEYKIDEMDHLLRVRMSGSSSCADLAAHFARVLKDPGFDREFDCLFQIDADAEGPIMKELPEVKTVLEMLAQCHGATKWAIVMPVGFKRTVVEYLLHGANLGYVFMRFFGDGVLQSSEEFPGIDWGIRVITHAEYNWCRDKYPSSVILALALAGYPNTAQMVDIFVGRNALHDYNGDPITVEVAFTHAEHYQQKDGLGCEPTSLANGVLECYVWIPKSKLEDRFLRSDVLWTTDIWPAIQSMNIETWYIANPGINSKMFTVQYSAPVRVNYNGEDDLSDAVGWVDEELTIAR